MSWEQEQHGSHEQAGFWFWTAGTQIHDYPLHPLQFLGTDIVVLRCWIESAGRVYYLYI